MTYTEGGELTLDDRLKDLAAGIIERIGFDPPELKEKLQPPQLRVTKGPPGVNSYCVPMPDGRKMILVGVDLYPFFHHYTRAAATYFLPSEPGGIRPSSFWPPACSALATTLDWISSPASVPLYPEFDLSPHQADVARDFADYAYRFALCHEIAHVALEHVDASPTDLRSVGGEDLAVLRASQQQELEADRFGLHLQIKSLPESELITGVASAVYFVHITGLRDARLMLLSHLVDHERWKIAYTHPPSLHRLVGLMGAADGLRGGWGSGLKTVHESLATLDGQVYDRANKQQEEVADAALSILNKEIADHGKILADTTAPKGKLDVPDNPRSAVTRAFLQLFERSPLGVLRALESPSMKASRELGAEEDRLRSSVIEEVASELPPEFQRFRLKTRVQRAEELA